MKPEASSTTDQGAGKNTGKKRASRTGQTTRVDDIPPENRATEGVKEDVGEGALPDGSTTPRVSPAAKGRHNIERGLHR